ncbi:MAG: hypothetical protein WC424_05860 [Bacilli bacterium]|jgi:hypothetical protein
MDLLHNIFSIIDWVMTTPSHYGLFHIISVIILFIILIIIAKGIKINKEKTVKIILIVFSTLMLLFEIIKQGLFTHVESAYQWYAFPFQFCSTPMYIAPLALIIKNGKLKDALYSFLAFYCLFGGLAVIIYPGDVFTSLVMINIQTMVHHSGMIIMGSVIIMAQMVKFDFKSLLKGTYVFLVLAAIAQLLNYVFYYAEVGTFNMFFISPFGTNDFPILSNIQKNAPYFVFLLSYILGFILVAFIFQKLCLILQKLHYLIHINSLKNKEEKPQLNNYLK